MSRLAWLLALCLLIVPLGASAEQKVRLMASTSPPYVDRTLPEQGLALELVRHIFSRTPYTAEVTIDIWSRALEGVTVGVYDALAAAWYSEERSRDMLFSEPYLGGRLIIVKARTNPAMPRNLAGLAGGRLGIQLDYAYGVDFGAVPGLQLVEENHLIQSLLNLAAGKVDYVIGDQRTMTQQLHEFLPGEVNKFQVLPIDLPSPQRHVAASRAVKGHESVVAAFNRALAETRRDGSYDAIVRKWDERYGGLE